MRTGLTKQEKTTDIWFDEKDPLIHIRTHNTDLKKRLASYAGQHPDVCRQTDKAQNGRYKFVGEKNMKKHRKCKKIIIAFVTVLFIAFVAVIGLHKTGIYRFDFLKDIYKKLIFN